MPPIEGLRVHAVDLAHPSRKRRFQRFDQKMIVIAHQAPGPHTPVEAIAHAAKIIDEFLAVLVIQKNISLALPRAMT